MLSRVYIVVLELFDRISHCYSKAGKRFKFFFFTSFYGGIVIIYVENPHSTKWTYIHLMLLYICVRYLPFEAPR